MYPVHVRVLPWYLLCSLGILGDEKTHKYPRAIGLIEGFPMTGYVGPGGPHPCRTPLIKGGNSEIWPLFLVGCFYQRQVDSLYITHDGSMGLVCLPTFTIKINFM